jgi:hypothetical protein
MIKFVPTVKYEVVIGVPKKRVRNPLLETIEKPTIRNRPKMVDVSTHGDMIKDWMTFAKEYYEKTDTYVSSIATDSKALYNSAWGCPTFGEETLTFNCTANPTFIKDMDLYEKGIFYITGKLKEKYEQHTITITKLNSHICYLTDEENEELKEL